MPSAPKKFDVNDVFKRDDLKAELQVSTPEDEQEKKLRLRKDFLGFLVKELAPYVLAMGFVVAIGWYCVVLHERPGSTPDEKQRAWTMLSAILALVVGIITGKAMK